LPPWFAHFAVSASTVQQLHHRFGVARTGERIFGCDVFDAFEIVSRESYFNRADVFLEIFSAFRSGNGNDVVTLGEHPRQSELSWRAMLFASDLFHFPNQFEVAIEVVALKPWHRAPIIALGQIAGFLNLAGEESSA